MYILLTVLILFLIVNTLMASFFFMELLASKKGTDVWYGNLIKAGVLTVDAVAALVLYATYSLHIWTL